MPTQKREAAKNYIGLLAEEIDEQCAAQMQCAGDRRMGEYFVGLVAAVLKRNRGESR